MKYKIHYLLVITLLVLAGCNATLSGNVTSQEQITVGVLAPVSGDFAVFGNEVVAGIQDANNNRVKLIIEDSKCDATSAASAYQKLTLANEVDYLIGPACGSPQQVVAGLLAQNDQVAITASAARGDLYETSQNQYFQMQYSLEKESAYMAQVIQEKNYENVLLVTYENDFSEVHANAFLENYKGNVERIVFNDVGSDINIIAPKIKDKNIDAIYSPDMAFFFDGATTTLTENGIDIPVYGTYVVALPFARPLVEGVTYSYPADLQGKQEAVYGIAYEATDVFINAIIDCETQGYGTTCVRGQLISSGKFDENGVSTRDMELFQIQNGETIKI